MDQWKRQSGWQAHPSITSPQVPPSSASLPLTVAASPGNLNLPRDNGILRGSANCLTQSFFFLPFFFFATVLSFASSQSHHALFPSIAKHRQPVVCIIAVYPVDVLHSCSPLYRILFRQSLRTSASPLCAVPNKDLHRASH